MPPISPARQWHPEDIGACRVLVPESREERAARHRLAVQMLEVVLGEIAVIGVLDPDMSLTPILDAVRPQAEARR